MPGERRKDWCAAVALAAFGLLTTVGTATASPPAANYAGQTITVVMHYPSPPASLLDGFTKDTGIKVNWVQLGFSDEQTKIAASAEANTYFADATDVDWSVVGEYAKTHWFLPLNKYFDVTALNSDVPQLSAFVSDGQLIGVPFDASFVVTTVNDTDFTNAGIHTMPTTMSMLEADLRVLQKSGMSHPLNLYLAATPGLTQCWYQLTAAFGGGIVDNSFKPLFTSPESAGYKALAWIVQQYKGGTVPPGDINNIDYTSFDSEMAQNQTAVTLCDYSGDVASVYNVPSTSKVVNQVSYIATPGTTGPGPVMANPDGIGIPRSARHPAAAAKFLQWFTSTENQAIWAGLDGPNMLISAFPLPMRLSSLNLLQQSGKLPHDEISQMILLLRSSQPILASKAPAGYVSFYNTTTTTIHDAAAGTISVAQAIKTIADAANQLQAAP
jgi:multiple sugar transport system substrate-binding protein